MERIMFKSPAIHNFLVGQAKARQASRSYDGEKDPIGALLTVVEWLLRFQGCSLTRHFRGKLSFLPFDNQPPTSALQVVATERWCEQFGRVERLRRRVLTEGCHLGASPVEMSRLLSDLQDALWGLGEWEDLRTQEEETAQEWWYDKYMAVADLTRPLKDLLAWKAACEGQNDPEGQDTLEIKALQMIFQRPELSVTALAQATGCSRRALYKMPLLRAALAGRKQGRKELPKGFRHKDGTIEAWE
jgi:hypothetical protein